MSRLRKISPSIPEIANAIIAPRSNLSTCASTRWGSCQNLTPGVTFSNPFKVSYPAPSSICQSRQYSQSAPANLPPPQNPPPRKYLLPLPVLNPILLRPVTAVRLLQKLHRRIFGPRCIGEYADAEHEY
ncbi:hypothetical protein H4I95_09578 [Botrytis cinerea]